MNPGTDGTKHGTQASVPNLCLLGYGVSDELPIAALSCA